MPRRKRFVLRWPWFSWRCDECNARHWSWRGFWRYLHDPLGNALPMIINDFNIMSEYAGVFSRDGLINIPPNPAGTGPNWARVVYPRIQSYEVSDAKE